MYNWFTGKFPCDITPFEIASRMIIRLLQSLSYKNEIEAFFINTINNLKFLKYITWTAIVTKYNFYQMAQIINFITIGKLIRFNMETYYWS